MPLGIPAAAASRDLTFPMPGPVAQSAQLCLNASTKHVHSDVSALLTSSVEETQFTQRIFLFRIGPRWNLPSPRTALHQAESDSDQIPH
jgi:hypothetical protein